MADTIPSHYTTEFSTNWVHHIQQSKARLDAFVEDEQFEGEKKRFDRIGIHNSRKRTERIGPTPIQALSTDSRWAYRQSFDVAKILDKDDAMNLGKLVLPTSDIVAAHAKSYARDCDDVAWQAAMDSAMTGELGVTASALPGSQTIVHGSSGLTLAKLIKANEILEDADLEDDAPRVLCVTARQLSDLLGNTDITSIDYNSVKALVSGQIDTFMGFKFVKIKRLRKSGSTRSCVGWVKGAVKRIKGRMGTDISQRKDLSMATQIYNDWHLGATRIYDEGVVVIECHES